MKLGPATKLEKKNKRRSKEFDDNVMVAKYICKLTYQILSF